MAETFPVRITGLDVRRAAQVLTSFVAYLDLLEREYNLHAMLASREGRAAIETWNAVQMNLLQTFAGADLDAPLDLTISVPRDTARDTATFVGALLDRGERSGRLSPEDVAFARGFLEQALTGLILNRV